MSGVSLGQKAGLSVRESHFFFSGLLLRGEMLLEPIPIIGWSKVVYDNAVIGHAITKQRELVTSPGLTQSWCGGVLIEY